MTIHGRLAQALIVAASLWTGGQAQAHYCSNIFAGPARLVVKPERDTVYVPSGGPVIFRVYLQNNFPYKLTNVQLRGVNSSYSISVSPSSQTIYPGQNVGYTFTVSGSGGNVGVSTLQLQVTFRQGTFDESESLVNQSPSETCLKAASDYYPDCPCGSPTAPPNCSMPVGCPSGEQTPSLNLAMLADRFPNSELCAGSPFFRRTGQQQLIKLFGYRFCWNSSGGWACLDQDCPSPCSEDPPWTDTSQFPQDCMRAGVELAALHARGKLGSDLGAAQAGAINAMQAGSNEHKCLAAVVGGYLWQGVTASSTLTSALNNVPPNCKAAAERAWGGGTQTDCPNMSGAYEEEAACAAAEGLRGRDGPVNSILKPKAGDSSYESLYYSYMLRIVSAHRRGPTTVGAVSFYPDAGAPLITDGGPPPPPPDARPPDTRPPDTRPPDSTRPPDARPPDTRRPDTGGPPPPDSQQPPADQTPVTPDAPQPPADGPPLTSDGTLPGDQTVSGDGVGPTADSGLASDGRRRDIGRRVDGGRKTNTLEGGCGCTVAGRTADPTGAALLLLLGGVVLSGLRLRRRKWG
jgi:MYXO-CTERM domain-containing protein